MVVHPTECFLLLISCMWNFERVYATKAEVCLSEKKIEKSKRSIAVHPIDYFLLLVFCMSNLAWLNATESEVCLSEKNFAPYSNRKE